MTKTWFWSKLDGLGVQYSSQDDRLNAYLMCRQQSAQNTNCDLKNLRFSVYIELDPVYNALNRIGELLLVTHNGQCVEYVH
jgi:hypothetical protein